jgi:hypothetical protein
MEAALITILIDVMAVIVAPAVALFSGRRRAFGVSLIAPVLVLAVIVVAVNYLGT